MEFPVILSTLQPFQMYIYNSKYSKLTFSHGSSADGEKVYGKSASIIGEYMQKWNFQDFHQMSEWGDPLHNHKTINILPLWSLALKWWCGLKWMRHKPLDRGVHSTTFDAEVRNVSFALISFMGFPAILNALQPFQICICNSKYSKLTFSNGSQLMGKRFMANLHASLESTCKSGISNIFTRCQN